MTLSRRSLLAGLASLPLAVAFTDAVGASSTLAASAGADGRDPSRVPALRVASTAALKALVPPAAAARVFVEETGFRGTFRWDPSDLSAEVARDPFEGLCVAPASAPGGSSGAWVRIVEAATYQGSWVGAVAANASTYHRRVQSLFDQMPAGSTFWFAKEPVRLDGPMNFLVPFGILRGHGGASRLTLNPKLAVFDMLRVGRSGIRVHNLALAGKGETTGIATKACLLVSHHVSGWARGLEPMEDIGLYDLELTNSSLPLALYGSPIDEGGRGLGVSPVKGIVARGLRLSSNFQLMTVFGVDDVDIAGVDGSYFEDPSENNSAHQFVCGIRINASRNVKIKARLTGGGRTHISHDAVRIGAGDLGGLAGRRQNENVRVSVTARNFTNGIRINECLGLCDISGSAVVGDTGGTELSYGVHVSASGVATGNPSLVETVGAVKIGSVSARGFACGYHLEGNVDRVELTGSSFVANSRPPDGVVVQCLVVHGLAGGTPRRVAVSGCNFIAPAGVQIRVPNISFPGHIVTVEDTRFSESEAPTAKLSGNEGVFMGSSLATAVSLRNCYMHPAGTWAAEVAA